MIKVGDLVRVIDDSDTSFRVKEVDEDIEMVIYDRHKNGSISYYPFSKLEVLENKNGHKFNKRTKIDADLMDAVNKTVKQVDDYIDNTEEASVSSGGSLRYNKGKPEFSHLSPEFISDMMALMTKSADKYGYLNWTKAQDLKTASDSLMRHFLKFQAGEDNDEESGYSHLTHVAVNAMILWQNYKDFGEEVDNRFSAAKKEAQEIKDVRKS